MPNFLNSQNSGPQSKRIALSTVRQYEGVYTFFLFLLKGYIVYHDSSSLYFLLRRLARLRSSSNACIVSASNPPANCNKQEKYLYILNIQPKKKTCFT
ncbi:LOW QUALITY PROTEIN: hypothetical protein TorRG33x02_169770 [Trema orientale]|uniref:Uncharacterized protein n=1 Tax=Trema orientale TaxID=63057 RepID=A0A2P5ENS6_TREOI|nr:LOW QUALITY PROTEIN: hypothetical protein TorRG33x02_169770 [Trema orientale]